MRKVVKYFTKSAFGPACETFHKGQGRYRSTSPVLLAPTGRLGKVFREWLAANFRQRKGNRDAEALGKLVDENPTGTRRLSEVLDMVAGACVCFVAEDVEAVCVVAFGVLHVCRIRILRRLVVRIS